MKAKYLGTYEVTERFNTEYAFYYEPILLKDGTHFAQGEWYPFDSFVRCGSVWQSKIHQFHAIASESNTSSIALKLSPCGEQAKLWRIW